MIMSDGERLIAVMLADLMLGLEIKGTFDATTLKQHVINNDLWTFNIEHGGMFSGDTGPTKSEVDETVDILKMFGFIKHSLDKLPFDDRVELEGNVFLKFNGFDANNDVHYHIAKTLINDLGRFQEFKEVPLDSHSEGSLANYRRILPVYKHVLQEAAGSAFTADHLKTIAHDQRW